MIKLIFKLFIIILVGTCLKVMSAENVFIKYRVNQEIITNLDIKKEKNYLLALNDQLKNLNEQKLFELAENSQIREIVKKIELLKYFDLNQKNPVLKQVIKKFYTKIGLSDEDEFEEYLNQYNLTTGYIIKKIEIETTWNQLIYDLHKDQIMIDEKTLLKKIKEADLEQNNKQYMLSEILFELKTGEKLDKKIDQINKSIEEIGFKNSANTFSISDSNKFGGSLGWVNERNLDNRLINILKKIKTGNYSKPIQIQGGILILKIDDIKNEQIPVNEKTELKKMIQFEKNKQLERFSKIYYNKVKINTDIDEK
jgi:peptidyl-prolyl cis-trans isomerase SurA